jgi:hypothetical protein
MYLLQDDIVKFVSEPASPPRLVNILEEGKGKAKERREVGEGDDCRAYTPGTATKEADRLLVEFPCTPTRTRAM